MKKANQAKVLDSLSTTTQSSFCPDRLLEAFPDSPAVPIRLTPPARPGPVPALGGSRPCSLRAVIPVRAVPGCATCTADAALLCRAVPPVQAVPGCAGDAAQPRGRPCRCGEPRGHWQDGSRLVPLPCLQRRPRLRTRPLPCPGSRATSTHLSPIWQLPLVPGVLRQQPAPHRGIHSHATGGNLPKPQPEPTLSIEEKFCCPEST